MTDRKKLIEKAVQAHTMARNGQDESRRDAWSAMGAALEAVGYFDMRTKLDALVEAGDKWSQMRGRDAGLLSIAEQRLEAALTAAKEQNHD